MFQSQREQFINCSITVVAQQEGHVVDLFENGGGKKVFFFIVSIRTALETPYTIPSTSFLPVSLPPSLPREVASP